MKILGDEIDVIAKFKGTNKPVPIKFSIKEGEQESVKVIKVDKVIFSDEEKLAGIKAYVYRCQSIIDGKILLYELKYYIDKCKWVLYKM
jgi:hypothetical protein